MIVFREVICGVNATGELKDSGLKSNSILAMKDYTTKNMRFFVVEEDGKFLLLGDLESRFQVGDSITVVDGELKKVTRVAYESKKEERTDVQKELED